MLLLFHRKCHRGFVLDVFKPTVAMYLISVKTARHPGKICTVCTGLALETIGAKTKRKVRAHRLRTLSEKHPKN